MPRRALGLAAACVLGLGWAAACGSGAPEPAAGGRVFVYAGGGSTIDVFQADLATGALGLRGTAAAGDDAYIADVDPRRRRLYVQTQLGIPVAIRTFAIRAADGLLESAVDHPLPHPLVEGVTQILLHPTAPWLLISATGGASGLQDQLMPVGADGQLGAAKVISTQYYGFTWEPTGRYFFGLDGVAIGQFVFDATAGSLTPNDPPEAAGSREHQMLSLAGHPNGRWYYSVEESRLGHFAFDAGKGTLTAQAFSPNPLPAEPIYWSSAVVHGGGRFLYVVGYVRATLVAVIDQFAVDPATGALTFVRREAGDGAHQITLGTLQAPLLLGDLLIIGGRSVAGAGRPVLAVYRIGATDGRLTPGGAPTELSPADTTVVNFILAAALPPP